jgi:hypothetical protein
VWHGGRDLAPCRPALPHGGRALTPWGMAAGACHCEGVSTFLENFDSTIYFSKIMTK